MFITEEMRQHMESVCALIEDDVTKEVYQKCFKSTWETTTELECDDKTFVITGDIEAMWLRDSSLQVMPYLPAIGDKTVNRMFRGLIQKQAEQILIDPYANAFNKKGDGACWCKDHTEMGPFIWERKYEVDSLAFSLYLLTSYYDKTQDETIFNETVRAAVKKIVHVWVTEQNHKNSPYTFERDSDLFTETLQNGGKGTPVGYTGMTWSGFRPSDDACTYHYLVPSNMLAVSVLKKLLDLPLFEEEWSKIEKLATEIEEGIYRFGTVNHEVYGEIFAFETDGLGNFNLMDDANLPSLLSAPYFGFCSFDDPIYQNTRNFILSKSNPFYFEGSVAKGIGSPHTPTNYIWHISLAMQGLTSPRMEEKKKILSVLTSTTGGTGFMHEGFDVDDPSQFTRSWFAWANSMFCLLVHDYYCKKKK